MPGRHGFGTFDRTERRSRGWPRQARPWRGLGSRVCATEAPELEVSVWAPGADFRARLNGLDVTERFAAPVEGVRSARFERGRDFELGRGSFLAAVGEPSSAALETVGFGFTAWQVVETSAVTPLALEHGATALVKRVSVNGRAIVEHRDHGGRLAAPQGSISAPVTGSISGRMRSRSIISAHPMRSTAHAMLSTFRARRRSSARAPIAWSRRAARRCSAAR